MSTYGNRSEIWDYLDLLLLHIAKFRRRKLAGANETEDFYNEFFNENDIEVMASGRDLRRRYRAEALTSAAWSHMPEGAKVLDVGCGTGDNLRYILRDKAVFFGLEYAERTARIAATILEERAKIRVGSATEIPFDNDEFDLVLCIEVLEHMEKDNEACREIARVLKHGGTLILSLPYRHWFPYYFGAMGHLRHYTRSDVEEMLHRAGLRITHYLPNYPRWSRFANYAYIGCRIYVLWLKIFGVKRSPVDAKLPFSRRPLMEIMFTMLEGMRRKEHDQDYAKLETSTFIVARKV